MGFWQKVWAVSAGALCAAVVVVFVQAAQFYIAERNRPRPNLLLYPVQDQVVEQVLNELHHMNLSILNPVRMLWRTIDELLNPAAAGAMRGFFYRIQTEDGEPKDTIYEGHQLAFLLAFASIFFWLSIGAYRKNTTGDIWYSFPSLAYVRRSRCSC